MTTTSEQPPEEDPSEGPDPHAPGRPEAGTDGGAEGPQGGRRTRLVLVAVVAVLVLVLAVLAWLLTAGPLSESAKQEREVGSALEDMGAAESFAEFNQFLCAEQRVPQDLVDTITTSGQQTGTDLDAMFRESIAGSLPEDLEVTKVDVEGDSALATVESGTEDSQPEEVRMRHEDGDWKVCESEVGMGSVPDAASEQPS